MDRVITKREILASVTIIAVLLGIGFWIADRISDKIADRNEKYNKAIKIEEKEIFAYGMKTDIGNAFVYGTLEAVDLVSYPEIKKEYMCVRKITEKYTKHTRTVTTTDSKGKTRTRTETYWTWDEVDSETKHSKELEFCGTTFPYKKIKVPDPEYIDTISIGYHLRDVYYGTGIKHKGTIFTKLKNGTIEDGSSFYENEKAREACERLTRNGKWYLAGFWVIWGALIAACVTGFCYLENKWLE